MSCFVLSLRPGEELLIEGVRLRSTYRTRLELLDRARFMLPSQVMRAEDATTPTRHLYLALQDAYAGPPAGREAAMTRAYLAAGCLRDRDGAIAALERFDAAEFHPALKMVRAMIRLEDEQLTGDRILVTHGGILLRGGGECST